MRIKAVVFDRDGTLIKHIPYLSRPEFVCLLEGVQEGIRKLLQKDIKLFIHSNQSGVGRGYFTFADAEACNQRMLELLGFKKSPFERICMAPEAPESPAVYRKPSPLFANELIVQYGFNAKEMCYVGDRGSDMQTAFNAGTLGIGVDTGLDNLEEELRELGLRDRYPVFNSFLDVISSILDKDP